MHIRFVIPIRFDPIRFDCERCDNDNDNDNDIDNDNSMLYLISFALQSAQFAD